jgi:hypothetical protein
MVEAGESEYSVRLKTRKLLIFRPAKNARYHEIASNWNVSGTQTFRLLANFVIKISLLQQLRHSSN